MTMQMFWISEWISIIKIEKKYTFVFDSCILKVYMWNVLALNNVGRNEFGLVRTGTQNVQIIRKGEARNKMCVIEWIR